MVINNDFKENLNKDEKQALRMRVGYLIDRYSKDEIERIIFSELEEIGLESVNYLDLLEDVLEEF